MLLPRLRRPEISVESAPNAPAVDVTITSAFSLFRRLTAFCTLLPPSDWYVSWSTILPPSCVQRALNAWTTFLK